MIRDLFGNSVHTLETCEPLGRREHLTFRGNVLRGRHGWLRLTPAYSLHVVHELLHIAEARDHVLDPFSGTGTTPLVSATMGVPCDALDINPFLVWLGNMKVTRFDSNTGDLLRGLAEDIAQRLIHKPKAERPWVPNIHAIEKWWDADVLEVLARLHAAIRDIANPREKLAGELLSIVFCKVMIQNANVSFGHQSMSFKPHLEEPESLPGIAASTNAALKVIKEFTTAANDVADSLESDRPLTDARVHLGDARHLDKVFPNRKFSMVITSPPYPNRMSYIRELRPYMYWLGFLEDGRQAGDLDWEAIGGTWGSATSLLGKWKPTCHTPIPYDGFDRMIWTIGENHELLARYVHRYFEDIMLHIRSLRSVLLPGAKCHYIVGNSKFYGTIVPVEKIYAAIFQNAGFNGINIETLRKRTSKKELFEYIVHACFSERSG